MSPHNVELARRGYEAALSGDLGTIADLLAPDVRRHGGDASAPGACNGRPQVPRSMRRAVGGGPVVELVDAGVSDGRFLVPKSGTQIA